MARTVAELPKGTRITVVLSPSLCQLVCEILHVIRLGQWLKAEA